MFWAGMGHRSLTGEPIQEDPVSVSVKISADQRLQRACLSLLHPRSGSSRTAVSICDRCSAGLIRVTQLRSGGLQMSDAKTSTAEGGDRGSVLTYYVWGVEGLPFSLWCPSWHESRLKMTAQGYPWCFPPW